MPKRINLGVWGRAPYVLKVHISIDCRRITVIDRIDTATVLITQDIPPDDGLNDRHRQVFGVDTVQLLFLQSGEKALHSGVIEASTRAAHALDCAMFC